MNILNYYGFWFNLVSNVEDRKLLLKASEAHSLGLKATFWAEILREVSCLRKGLERREVTWQMITPIVCSVSTFVVFHTVI